MTLLAQVLLSGTAAARPVATTVTPGTVYFANDTNVISQSDGATWSTVLSAGGVGTVTSVGGSFTGGLISVGGSPVTGSGTLALTVAGTSGGIPYFSGASTWATSGALAQYGLVLGGGAGAAPTTLAAVAANQILTSAGTGANPTYDYPRIAQNSQTAAYTTLASDKGGYILHPISDNNPRTFTIDSNTNLPFPTNTAITFVNMINTVTIAITTDTMYLAGSGATGSRQLAAYGVATAIKVDTNVWIISGTNLT